MQILKLLISLRQTTTHSESPCTPLTAWCPPVSPTRGQGKFSSNRSASFQHWSPALRSAATCTSPPQTLGSQLQSGEPSWSKHMLITSSSPAQKIIRLFSSSSSSSSLTPTDQLWGSSGFVHTGISLICSEISFPPLFMRQTCSLQSPFSFSPQHRADRFISGATTDIKLYGVIYGAASCSVILSFDSCKQIMQINYIPWKDLSNTFIQLLFNFDSFKMSDHSLHNKIKVVHECWVWSYSDTCRWMIGTTTKIHFEWLYWWVVNLKIMKLRESKHNCKCKLYSVTE